MKKRINSFFTIFLLFSITFNVSTAMDYLHLKNHIIIDLIKQEIKESKNNLPYIDYDNIVFASIENKKNSFIVSFPVFSLNKINFIKRVVFLVIFDDINFRNDIFTFMASDKPKLNFKFSILNLKFLQPNNIKLYTTLSYIENDLGLKNYINFEKDGRVYYTVPSEDKLDDIHMVYESGNEKKEFKFTNLPEKPIVPVEETKIIQKNLETKKSFFSLPSFISKFFKKNNNDFLDEEQKKLKVD